MAEEVRSRLKANARARQLELFDPVTQLPSRYGLNDTMLASRRFALVQLRLDTLDQIENVAGHVFVDTLMVRLANHLAPVCPHADGAASATMASASSTLR